MFRLTRALTAALFLATVALNALAQEGFPNKPVRVLLPLPPGSATENVLRASGQEFQTRVGQPLLVENRPGGNMVIGAEACARAAADGYTLCLLSNDAMSVNPHLMSKLPYDADKDFKAVTRLFFIVAGLMATAAVPVNSVKELQALASAKPGSLNCATMGPGSITDIYRQWLSDRWKANIVGIPYKGGPLIITALVAGEIHLGYIGVGNLAGQLKSGKVKVLAVNSLKRARLLPEVPTVGEAGIGGFPAKAWWGLLAPAGTPDASVGRLNAEFIRIYNEPKLTELMEDQFLEPGVLGSEAFASFMKTDREAARLLVREFNVPRQ